MLFLALLLVADAATASAATEWANSVLRFTAESSGDSWPPAGPEWKSVGGKPAPLYAPLHRSLVLLQASEARLEPIVVAIKAWRRAGERGDMKTHHLKTWIREKPPGPKQPRSKCAAPWRWKSSAILKVAALVKRYGIEMRKLLRLDAPAEEVLSAVEELELLREECAEKDALLAEADANLRREKAGRRMAATRLQEHVRAKREWRKAKVALFAERLAAAKALVKEKAAKDVAERGDRENELLAVQYEEQVTKLKQCLARARAAKRENADGAASSLKRLKRAQLAERLLKRNLQQAEEDAEARLQELNSDSGDGDEDGESPQKQGRREANGRFASAPWQLSPLIWAQLGRRVSPSAVNANITDVLAAFAPGEMVPLPCEREMQKKRGELTVAGEAIAAFRVAMARRIISFGWDESTKFGMGLLSTNTQIEPHDAPGTSVDLVQRGGALTAGGTSEYIASEIAQLFAHSRELLQDWKAVHEEQCGSGSWEAASAPNPSAVGMHRLCENTVLESDTCNGARKAKRLVLVAVMAAVREKQGEEAWDALSESERKAESKVFIGDCHGHLRNIIIKAMGGAATKHLKEALEDDLAEFSSFDRMSVDCMDLIHAIFKELHGGGEYAKGKGREFMAWLKKHYPGAMFVPFEKSGSSRMDLAFDGAVPIFMNRIIILEFLHTLVNVPGANNKLEKFLWQVLRCNEMTAVLRVCTLWQTLITNPMRWLTGSSTELHDWGLDNSNEVLDLVYDSMVKVAADGHTLLDPSFDPLESIAAKQPKFATWRSDRLLHTVQAPDGTKHFVHARVLAEARSPAGSGNAQATEMVVALAEAMAEAALVAMRDPLRAIADKLTSQDGVNAIGKSETMHAGTSGAHMMNDLVETNFGSWDLVARM